MGPAARRQGDLCPPDVRHRQVGRETPHPTGEQAEARYTRGLVARLEEQLQAETDAEYRPAAPSARAAALNTASTTWCAFCPRSRSTCRVRPPCVASARKNSGVSATS